MELIKTEMNGVTITLFEDVSNHNIIGRSIYSLSITCQRVHNKDLGNNKEKALNLYRNVLSELIDDEIVEDAKNEIYKILGL